MRSTCEECGAEGRRLIWKLDDPRWLCGPCRGVPEEKIRSAADQKIWLMADVNPNEYETVNGVRKMKDWADAEHTARMIAGDGEDERVEALAKERKRQQVRQLRATGKTSLSAQEAKEISDRLREQLERQRALDAGLILPD